MTTKHTPGPWHIAFGGMDGDDFAVIGSKHSERAVCNLEPRDYTQANARLIAAAPELLQALDEIVAEWDAGNIGRITTIPGTPGWEESVGVKWARAAIAKATGE
jgi:hypothetical protein